MSLADNVRVIRQRQGLTRRDLAARGGIEYDTIANIENRRVTNPGGGIISALARGLGVDAEELLARDALDELQRIYHELRSSDDRVLVAWASKAIADCQRFLHSLQKGDAVPLYPTQDELPEIEIEWLTALVGTTHATLDATSCLAQANWWQSRWGHDYLRRNIELASNRGVAVRRLFVFENSEDRDKGLDQARDQSTFGIQVGYLTLDEVDVQTRSLLLLVWDMALVDGRWLVHLPSLSRRRMVTEAQLTREEFRVTSAMQAFQQLWSDCNRL